MLECNSTCNFIEEIDFLVKKHYSDLGNPGSRNYKSSLTKKRKAYLNKWFSYFSGIHNPNGAFSFCDITEYELECKNQFLCLLLDINKSFIFNKLELKEQLEVSFDTLVQSNNPNIYSILLFLISLHDTKSIKPKRFFNFKEVRPPSLNSRINGLNFKSSISDEGIYDFASSYPSYIFSGSYLPDISSNNTTIYMSSFDDTRSKFMPNLSRLSSIKCPTIYTSSGYVSNTESLPNCTENDAVKINLNDQNFTVRYPFSSFVNKSKSLLRYWDEEFLEEWEAFKKGTELPRRFIWEDRGRNVGPEKPRLTEWNCPFSVGNGAISLALYQARFNPNFNEKTINDILNAYAVPINSWIGELIMLRLGVSTPTFKWNQEKNSFYLAVMPPKYLVQQFEPHLLTGTIYSRLCLLADGKSGFNKSIIRDGLLNRLQNILSLYREVFTTLKNTFASILEFSVVLLPLTNQIQYFGDLFEVNPNRVECWPEHIPNTSPIKQGGIPTLKYIYETSFNMPIQEYVYINFYLLEGCLQVVLDQLYEWIYKGQILIELNLERTKDFLLFANETYHSERNEKWWHYQFVLHDVTLKSNNKWLFDELSKEILRCGKSVKLLSLIQDSNPFLYNSKIVKYRPGLRLCYSSEQTNKFFVKEYVQVVLSIAADLLKSQKEIVKEKQRKSKLKTIEAQKSREKFLKSMNEKIYQQKFEIQQKKNKELEQLKIAAGLEIKRKIDSLKEEKRLDKELLEKSFEQNQKIINELKYDLTLIYSQKFADAEAREKLSLNRIKEFQLKLQESGKSVTEIKTMRSTVKEIIGTVIEEVQQTLNPDEQMNNENILKVEETMLVETPHNIGDSISQQDLYPGANNFHPSQSDISHILKFQKINTHGHTADSTAGKLLYPVSEKHFNDNKNLNEFECITPVSDSTSKELLYPIDLNDRADEIFPKPNVHGHSSNSIVEKSFYPESHAKIFDGEHMKNFRNINTHGHTSDSTVQKALYPDSHYLSSAARQTSQGNEKFIENFKSINTQGHVSESSVQELMYPFRKQLQSIQKIDNSIIECSSNGNYNILPIAHVNVVNFCSVIKSEISNRTELFNLQLSHTSQLREDSIKLSRFHTFNNDVFNHINRSTFSHFQLPIQSGVESTNQSLIIEEDTIDTILNRSLISIIMTQVKLADSSIMYTIFNDYRFRDHLEEIRKYFFLEDGNFSSLLLPPVFDLVSKSSWTNNRIHRLALLDILKSAVNCIHSNNECLCRNVCLANNSSDIKFDNKLDNFTISYTISWPLNIIIHQRQILQYQLIFRAIVQIKYSIWCINETHRIIRSWNLKSNESNRKFTPFYLCLQEMDHWVRSMDSSLGNQVSGYGAYSWREMVNKLDNGNIDNLDSLIESHGIYLDGVILQCVLAGDYTETTKIPNSVKNLRENVRKLLIEMLGMCSKYHRLVNINHWQSSESHYQSNNKILHTVIMLHKKFRICGDCLLKIIKNAPENSYLDQLSTCLDYNEFYYKHTLV